VPGLLPLFGGVPGTLLPLFGGLAGALLKLPLFGALPGTPIGGLPGAPTGGFPAAPTGGLPAAFPGLAVEPPLAWVWAQAHRVALQRTVKTAILVFIMFYPTRPARPRPWGETLMAWI